MPTTEIITNGLVSYLDTKTSLSYRPGTTRWNDLSGNQKNFNLINGPTYTSDSGGGIVFDGTNDAATSTSTILQPSAYTLAIWIKHATIGSTIQRYITLANESGVIRYDGANSVGQLAFYLVIGGVDRQIRVNSAIVANQAYYIVGTWDGTTSRLYKQGVEVGNLTPTGTPNTSSATVSLSSGGGETLNGNMYQVAIYNRTLSAAEVLQNYNLSKSRFGL